MRRMTQPTARDPDGITLREEAYSELDAAYGFIQTLLERIPELELDDVGWERMSAEAATEFSRDGLHRIAQRARLFYLKNPLIRRGVDVQALYVWGQGVNVSAPDVRVNEVVQRFMDDPGNTRTFTSHQAQTDADKLLAVQGNLFVALFTQPASGRTHVRMLPMGEVRSVMTNPEDASEPWYWIREFVNAEGKAEKRAYADFRYWPQQLPTQVDVPALATVPVEPGARVYHVRTGGLGDMRWGVSEVYAALDWAYAYKGFLEDTATLFKALSRIAWKMTVTGKDERVAAARQQLSRQPASATMPQENRTIAGSNFVSGPGINMEAMSKSGATISPEDGRRIALMAMAAMGLPETFFGDVSVGTLATATSLDRPTELKMRDRQQLWSDTYRAILDYVVDRAIEAPDNDLNGAWEPLPGATATWPNGEGRWVLEPNPEDELAPGEEAPEEGDRTVDVAFPSILEHDVLANVNAVVAGITLGGSPLNDVLITPRQASALLLQALGVDEVDEWLEDIFPTDDDGNPVPRPDQQQQAAPAAQPPPGGSPPPGGAPPPAEQPEVTEAMKMGLNEIANLLLTYAEDYRAHDAAAGGA